MLLLAGLVGCTAPIAFPLATPAPIIPTIGPLQDLGGGSGRLGINLQSSTNCAEVHEVVTFTLTLSNTATYPITLTGSPTLDIVMSPRAKNTPHPAPSQYWSETSEYPTIFHPVFSPGEVRTYAWKWIADNVYTTPPEAGGVEVSVITAELLAPNTRPQPNGASLYVGIGTLPQPMPDTFIRCADMQH